jgi:hypothetical protein
MQNNSLKYLHLLPDAALPKLGGQHRFKAVVVIEAEVSQMWQWEVSRWLVSSGCRYMLAWGKDCSSWDDAVDEANLERFDYGDIADEETVMTTWHEDDDLEEVFWFAKNRAKHPVLDLNDTVLIHICGVEKHEEFEELYAHA